MRTGRGKIVVGISADQNTDAVLEYAAVEAARRGCGVHLVLVEHSIWDPGGGLQDVQILDGEFRRTGLALLATCEELLRRWLPDTASVSTEVALGRVGRALREIGEHSEMVVLQHHRMGRPFVLPRMSVTNAVASRATMPVVAVPDDWHEVVVSHDVVIAGIDNTPASRAVAEAALDAASTTNGAAMLLHVWSWADDEDGLGSEVRTSSRADRVRFMETRLERNFESLIAKHSNVSCRVDVVDGQPDLLVSRSAQARLLVVGRNEPPLPLEPRLGPVTRAMLRDAHCPVMVVAAE